MCRPLLVAAILGSCLVPGASLAAQADTVSGAWASDIERPRECAAAELLVIMKNSLIAARSAARTNCPSPHTLTEQLEWLPESGIAPLRIDLPAFFGRVFDSAS